MFDRDFEDLRCVFNAEKGSLRVEVQEYKRECGHAGHLVEVYASREGDLSGETEFLQVACLSWSDVPFAIELMQEASDIIAGREGVRPLPTVRLWGKSYFIDERLKEMRNVEDPHDRVELRMGE